MPQSTLVIADSNGTAFLSALNAALAALGTLQKGNTRPSGVAAGWFWLDDNTPSATVWTLNFYDGAHDIPVAHFDTTNNWFLPILGGTTRLFQSTSDTPGYGNTDTGGSIEKNAQGAALFLSRSAFAPLYSNVNGNDQVAVWLRSGVVVGSVSVSAGLTTYGTTSDERVKNRIVRLVGARERIRRAVIIRHGFVAHPKGRLVDGVLAHQFAGVVPHAVTGKRGAVYRRGPLKGQPRLQQVDYSKGVPLLFAGHQELDADLLDLRKVVRVQARQIRGLVKVIEKLVK